MQSRKPTIIYCGKKKSNANNLVRSMQVNKNVDGGNENFGENQNNYNPLE